MFVHCRRLDIGESSVKIDSYTDRIKRVTMCNAKLDVAIDDVD